MLPIYTRLLTKADYGMLDLLTTSTALLTPIFGGGLAQTVYINFFHTNGLKREKMVKEVLLTFLVYSVPLLAIALGFSHLIAPYLSKPQTPVTAFPLLYMAILPAFWGFFTQVGSTLLKNSQKAFTLSAIQVVSGALMALLNIYGVVYLGWGYFAVIGSNFIMSFLQAAFFVFLGTRYQQGTKARFNTVKAMEYMKVGYPFVVGAIANWVMIGADRWFIVHYHGLDELGLYGVAYKFGFVFQQLFVMPYIAAIGPRIMERYRTNLKKAHPYMLKVFFVYFAIGVVLIAGAALVLPYVYKVLIGKVFQHSIVYVFWILIGFLFWGCTQIWFMRILYLKRTVLATALTIASSLLNIGCCVVLIPKHGAMGAAWATAIAYFGFFLSSVVVCYLLKEDR